MKELLPSLQEATDRRRRHGLDGAVQVLRDPAQQSELIDWTEYQDYELSALEHFETRMKKIPEELKMIRQKMAEANVSAFEDVQELGWEEFMAAAIALAPESNQVDKEVRISNNMLEVAQARLSRAQSDEIGPQVDVEKWVCGFEDDSRRAQNVFDAIPSIEDSRNHWFADKQGKVRLLQEGDTEIQFWRRFGGAEFKRNYATRAPP